MLRIRGDKSSLGLCLVLLGALRAGEGLANAPASTSAVERSALEVTTGKGFVGRMTDLLGKGSGKVYPSSWLEIKFRPFFPTPRWQAIGWQLGAHQSDDITKSTACRLAPAIAGRRYCSTSDIEYDSGAHFTALYSGIQAEMIETLLHESKPVQIYLGTGTALIQSALFPVSLLPYFSIEFLCQMRSRLLAKAAVFVSYSQNPDSFGAAVPELTLEYRF